MVRPRLELSTTDSGTYQMHRVRSQECHAIEPLRNAIEIMRLGFHSRNL